MRHNGTELYNLLIFLLYVVPGQVLYCHKTIVNKLCMDVPNGSEAVEVQSKCTQLKNQSVNRERNEVFGSRMT